jgi:hypothetical protein
MLTRNEVALFDGALFGKATEAFQEQLLAFPTAQPANCITMSCHLTFSFGSFESCGSVYGLATLRPDPIRLLLFL